MPARDRLARGLRRLQQERVGVHDHAGRAVAALEAAVVDERLLERMQLAVAGEALDRRDVLALDVLQRGLARSDGLAVDDHRAGAADPGAAAVLRSGELEVGAQHPEERAVLVGVEGHRPSVQPESDGSLHARPLRSRPSSPDYRASERRFQAEPWYSVVQSDVSVVHAEFSEAVAAAAEGGHRRRPTPFGGNRDEKDRFDDVGVCAGPTSPRPSCDKT